MVRSVPFLVHNTEYLTTYLFRYLGTFSWLLRNCSHNDNCIAPFHYVCGVRCVCSAHSVWRRQIYHACFYIDGFSTETPRNIQTSFAHSEKNKASRIICYFVRNERTEMASMEVCVFRKWLKRHVIADPRKRNKQIAQNVVVNNWTRLHVRPYSMATIHRQTHSVHNAWCELNRRCYHKILKSVINLLLILEP